MVLEQITFPAPVIELAVEPRTKADQDRLSLALQRLTEEDPTFQVRRDERLEQTILAGMGELHLDVLLDRLRREFGVDTRVGRPQVAYYETITRPARAEGRLVKQTGGRGQFAVVELEVESLPAGTGFVFENKVVGSRTPAVHPAVEAGIRDAMSRGVLAEHPWWTSRSRCWMAKPTRWTHRSEPSERPRRWPCAKPYPRPILSCWNRLCASRCSTGGTYRRRDR